MNDETKKKPEVDKPTKAGPKTKKPGREMPDPADEEPAFNTVMSPEEVEGAAAQAPSGISRASAVLLFLVASLFGGTIGWIGPSLFGSGDKKIDAMQIELDRARADLSAAAADRQQLSDTLAKIQSDTRRTGSNTSTLSQTLAGLQADIDTLKQQPETVDYGLEITALSERLTALAAFSGDAGETGENALELVSRLEAVETGTEALAELDTRITILESGLDVPEPVAAFPTPDTEPINIPIVENAEDQRDALQVLIDSFPRKKMLEAVRAQEVLAAKEPSWLQKVLSRHVKVRDNDGIAPVDVIDDAEAALRDGRIGEAVSLINTLNPPVKSVATEWISAAIKAEKLLEKEL